MTNRWWIYQCERFPLLGHGPLIAAFSSSAISFSFLLRHQPGSPPAAAFLVAFISSLLFFLQLRIADEFKDFEEDSRYRPYRPVPRGLVKLPELARIAFAAAAIQLGLALWWGPPSWESSSSPQGPVGFIFRIGLSPGLAGLLLIVWLYLTLMSKEFFVRDWIKARPFTYLWTHMLIMPLIDFYATACDWMNAAGPAPSGLFWFLMVSFSNGVVVEIGRKIRAPADEEPGVQTYTALWGRPTALAAWLIALIVTAGCAWRAAVDIAFSKPILIMLGLLLGLAGWLAARFLSLPSSAGAKRFEHFSGLWTLLMYLGLGLVPLLWRHVR